MKNEEPYHLVDAVKEYGFESLEEYFAAKRDHEFSQLEFEVMDTTPEKAIADVMNCIDNKKTAVLFAATERTLVWNGNNSEFNENYCEERGIPIYPLYTGGGTIVSTPGDLNIGICYPVNSELREPFVLSKFADIFRKYTDKLVKIYGNDILIDGLKVLGCTSYNRNGMFVFITSVSLSEKESLISEICLKHSTKQPSNIDFMDASTLRSEVEKWLHVQ